MQGIMLAGCEPCRSTQNAGLPPLPTPQPPDPHLTCRTICSAFNNLSVEGPLPIGTRGHSSSVTASPLSAAHTLMLDVKTNEPVPSQRSMAALTCTRGHDGRS